MEKKNISVTVTLDEKGNLKINSNLNPIASVKLLADAQSVILTDILQNGIQDDTDVEGESETTILES